MDQLLRILLGLSDVAYFLSAISSLLLIGWIWKRKETVAQAGRNIFLYGMIFAGLFALLGLSLFVSSACDASARFTLTDSLALCDPAKSVVQLDGRPVNEPARYLAAFQQMEAPRSNKSFATARVKVAVECGGRRIDFVLGQDSEFDDEFWVFKDGQHFPDQFWQIGTLPSPLLRAWLAGENPPAPNILAAKPAPPWFNPFVINSLAFFILTPIVFWIGRGLIRMLTSFHPHADDG